MSSEYDSHFNLGYDLWMARIRSRISFNHGFLLGFMRLLLWVVFVTLAQYPRATSFLAFAAAFLPVKRRIVFPVILWTTEYPPFIFTSLGIHAVSWKKYLKLFYHSQQHCSVKGNSNNAPCCFCAVGRYNKCTPWSFFIWHPIFDFEHLSAVVCLTRYFLVQRICLLFGFLIHETCSITFWTRCFSVIATATAVSTFFLAFPTPSFICFRSFNFFHFNSDTCVLYSVSYLTLGYHNPHVHIECTDGLHHISVHIQISLH